MEEKGFLDRVLQFMGIQEEEESKAESDAPKEPPPASRNGSLAGVDASKRKGRLVSLPGPGKGQGQMRLSVLQPRSYEEVQQIADHLKEREPVIVSLEGVDKAISRRILDFVSGTTYALDGSIHRIGEEIFLFAPLNVAIDANIARTWENEEEIFPK